jgi:predicted lipoprotein
VSALASSLRDRAGKLYALWAPDKGNFAKDFTQGTGMFATPKAAADRLGNQLVFASISIESVRMGKPLGKKNGGTIDPKLEETPRSDNSLRDLQASLSSIDAAYRGARDKDGQGLDDLVRAKSTQLDADIVRDLAAAKASLEAVPPPLRTALVSSTPKVEEAWTKNRTLKSTLSTELISALGATLTFSDADGD